MENVFNQLRLYNNWANQTVLNSFDSYGSLVPSTALLLLSHIVNTQSIWLSRIKAETTVVDVWENHTLEACRELHNVTSEKIKQQILNLNALHKIEYKNTKGIIFQNSLSDILMHLFNHGTYHRAQIAIEMRRAGLEPVNTDFINFARYTPVL